MLEQAIAIGIFEISMSGNPWRGSDIFKNRQQHPMKTAEKMAQKGNASPPGMLTPIARQAKALRRGSRKIAKRYGHK